MAKKSASLNDFSKGLNSSTAERDIESTEFVDVKNFNVYRPGLLFLGHKAEQSSDETTDLNAEKYFIRGIGPGASLGDGFNSESVDTFTGQRLFHFKCDYPFANYFAANYGASISSTRSYTNTYHASIRMYSQNYTQDDLSYSDYFPPFMGDATTLEVSASTESYSMADKYNTGSPTPDYSATHPGANSRLSNLNDDVNKDYFQSGIAYPYVDWTLGNELPPLNRVTTSSFPWSEWARWEYEPATRGLYQLGISYEADYWKRLDTANNFEVDAHKRGWAQTWPFELSRDEYFNMAILSANPQVRGTLETAYDSGGVTQVARMMLRFDRMMSGSQHSENGGVMNTGANTNSSRRICASRLRPGTWYKLKAKIKNLSEHPCEYFGLCYDQTILWNYNTTKGGHISYNNVRGEYDTKISDTSGYEYNTASEWRKNYFTVQFNYDASWIEGLDSWTETKAEHYICPLWKLSNPPGGHPSNSSYAWPLHSNWHDTNYNSLNEGHKYPWVASNDANEEGTEILDWLDPISHNYGLSPEWLKFNIKSNIEEPEFGYYEIRFKTSMPPLSSFSDTDASAKAWVRDLDRTYFSLALSQYEKKDIDSHAGGAASYPHDKNITSSEVHKDFLCAIAWLAIEVDTDQSDGVESEIEKVGDEYLVLGGAGDKVKEDFTSEIGKYVRNVWTYSLKASTQEDIGLKAWTSEGFDSSGESFETTWKLGEYPNKLNVEDYVYFDTNYPNFPRRKDWLAPYYETNWVEHPFNIDMDYYFTNNALRGIDVFAPNQDNGFWKGYISREMYGNATDYWYKYSNQASEWKHVHGAWYEAGWFLLDRRFKKPTFGRFFWSGESAVNLLNSGDSNGVTSSTFNWAYPRVRVTDGHKKDATSSTNPRSGTAFWNKGWYGNNPEGESEVQVSDVGDIGFLTPGPRTQIAHGSPYFRTHSIMTAPEVFWAGYRWHNDSGQNEVQTGAEVHSSDHLMSTFVSEQSSLDSTFEHIYHKDELQGWKWSPDTVNGHDINVSFSIDAGQGNMTTGADSSDMDTINRLPAAGTSYGAYDNQAMTEDMTSKKKLGITYLYDGDNTSDFIKGEQQETSITVAGDVLWKKMNYKDGTKVGKISNGGFTGTGIDDYMSDGNGPLGSSQRSTGGYWTFPTQERVLDLSNVSGYVQPIQICWTHGRMLHRANPRLTGFCIYIKDIGETNPTDWCLLFEVNFLTSKYKYYGEAQVQESTILGMQTTSRKNKSGEIPIAYTDNIKPIIPVNWNDPDNTSSLPDAGVIPSLHYSGSDIVRQMKASGDISASGITENWDEELSSCSSIMESYLYRKDRHSDEAETMMRTVGTVGGERWCTEVHPLGYMPTVTYWDRHGYDSDDLKDDLRYKCSVVGSNKVYIGNISYDGKTYSDRVLISPVLKYDTFPVTNFVNYGTSGDGDEIVELLFHKRHLIVLKNKSVIIIQEDEVESTSYTIAHDLKTNGIRTKNNAVQTSNGVFWLNKHGLFMFDGEDVKNLLEKEIKIADVTVKKKRITQQVWSDTFNKDEAYITYDSELNIIICGDNLKQDIDKNKNEFVYDIVTESFTKYSNSMSSDAMTFPVVAFDNKPLFLASGDTNESFVWDNNSKEGVNELLLITKDIDFKDPIKRKKFYKLYVTFKSEHYFNYQAHSSYEFVKGYENSNSNVVFYYALNGTKNWQEFDYIKSINYTDEGETATQGKRGLIPYENEDAIIGTLELNVGVSDTIDYALFAVSDNAKALLKDGSLIKIGDEVIPLGDSHRQGTYRVVHFKNTEQEEGITKYRSLNGVAASTYSTGTTVSIFSNDWNVAELVPKSTDTDKNKFYSIQFKIEASKGTDDDPDTNTTKVPSNFQINDMNIVYREKKVK